jgi:hypothetical protein
MATMIAILYLGSLHPASARSLQSMIDNRAPTNTWSKCLYLMDTRLGRHSWR